MIQDIEPTVIWPGAETFERFDEVLSQLIESSDMLDYGEEEFESWCNRLLVECRIFKHAEYQSKNPRHPKGLIRHLKKCLTDLNKVRANFGGLPDP